MPIGKNAIKRVENNGYSKVTTSAPDMENSEELLPAPVETAEPAPAPVKKRAYVRRKPVGKAAEKALKDGKNGFEQIKIGEELPYWLL